MSFRRRLGDLVRRLAADEQGVTAVVVALSMTVLLGFAGLAIDVSLWYHDKRAAQGAADSAAYSAGVDRAAGDTAAGVIANAKAVSAQYGFVDGAGGVVVAVNAPPASGPNTSTAGAVEVIVTKTESLLFTSFFIQTAKIAARAVATGAGGGKYCVQTLDVSANVSATVTNGGTLDVSNCGIQVNGSGSSALYVTGGATLKATTVSVVGSYATDNGGSIVASGSESRNAPSITDPYAARATLSPGGCTSYFANYGGGQHYNLSPGHYCYGLGVDNGATVTLSPGIYFVDGGTFSVQGGSTLNATSGVTIVLTGGAFNCATAQIGSGASLNITAPTSGPTAGLAIMQDANAPQGGVNNLSGGAGINITGALYFPHQTVDFSNGASNGSNCTQLIAYDVVITGGTRFQSNCAGTGVTGIGAVGTALVE